MTKLKTYRAKRDFKLTREPRGGARDRAGRRYVIQKHAATRLHYDLRLELDGVMMSWAVTRGPSLVPGEKRLAIHVEDHPVEYNSFEGTIPKGQYGGGTVMIWDRGSWKPEGDPHKGMAKGHLDFALNGEKLQGRWHLVRMNKRPGERQEPWLLIKSEDEAARSRSAPDILEEMPLSVVSGRSIPEIAKAGERVWHSNRAATDQPDAKPPRAARSAKAGSSRAKSSAIKSSGPSGSRKPAARPRAATGAGARAKSPRGRKTRKSAGKAGKENDHTTVAALPGARLRPFPDFVSPSLATLADRPPTGSDYVHEAKFDGYRMQAHLSDGSVKLFTRTGLDWTHRFRDIAGALSQMPSREAILDGEIVARAANGISDFSVLQEDLKNGRRDRMAYYAFDLLYADGCDLTRVALVDRKAALADIMQDVPEGLPLYLSEHFETGGATFLEKACRIGLEGIVSKKRDAPYHAGRAGDWIKTKCTANQEFVIAGYEKSTTASRAIRALVLGYYENGVLRYAGRVGTGFKVAIERDLHRRLDALASPTMSFTALPEEERRRKVRWVRPELVAEIDFRGWTHGEVLRQASFKGLREDKPARQVVRERAVRETAVMETDMNPAASKSVRSGKNAAPAARGKVLRRQDNAVSVAGVALSHPDRVYWDDAGITKRQLAEYYEQVWDWMAPHVVDRPLALVRCPEGANFAKCFFQKHASAGLDSERLRRVPLPGEEAAIAIRDLPGLIALAQAGVLEIHTWGTDADHVETCNRLVLDLDPGPELTFADVKQAARNVKKRLEDKGLQTFLKTTGGKGLHVVAPIAPTDWDSAKDFAHALARDMERDEPERYVSNMAKRLRNKRIFVDYLRNGRGATAIAPYSTRARAGATVATPIAWDELGGLKTPNGYTVLNLMARLKKLKRDPWADMKKIRQKLPKS
ncbi:MAG: DNA ligase D [Pseudorhodoplanes sp.]